MMCKRKDERVEMYGDVERDLADREVTDGGHPWPIGLVIRVNVQGTIGKR